MQINDFIANSLITRSKFGILKNNRFIVYFNGISSVVGKLKQNPLGNVESDLSFNAIQVQVPDITLEIDKKNINSRYYYTLKERSDADLQITFIDDTNMSVKKFFVEWNRLGFDINSLTRRYIDEITCNSVTVYNLKDDGSKAEFFDKFEDVYPYKINDVNFDKTSDGEILYTTVVFKYKKHDF